MKKPPSTVREQLDEAYLIAVELAALSERLTIATEEAAKALGLPITKEESHA